MEDFHEEIFQNSVIQNQTMEKYVAASILCIQSKHDQSAKKRYEIEWSLRLQQ
eukprot:c26324_g4_i1 orf=172-330(+)